MTEEIKRGSVSHIEKLVEDWKNTFLNPDSTDLTICIGLRKFLVHKVVLASRSEYFKALLFGGMKESSENELKLTGTTPDAFQHVLEYFYTGQLELGSMELTNLLQLLSSSHEWLLTGLVDEICTFLKGSLTLKNTPAIMHAATFLDLTELQDVCFLFWDKNANAFLEHSSFAKINSATLCDIIKRDSFYAKEELIFEAFLRWSEESEEDVKLVSDLIRLSNMNEVYLLEKVGPSGLVDYKRIVEAALIQQKSKEIELQGNSGEFWVF